MNKKIFAALGIVALLVALLPGSAVASRGLNDKPIDVGPELRTWEASHERIAPIADNLAKKAKAAAEAASETPYTDCVQDMKIWMSADFIEGQYFFDVFYLVAVGEYSELWVQVDLSYPLDDPRNPVMVTCEQAEYLLDEFDYNMMPKEVDFFGPPDFHDGSYEVLSNPAFWAPAPVPDFLANPTLFDPYDSDGKQVVLVSNFIDEQYYDPTYPNYVAGFYSPSFEFFFDRNIMSIDSREWNERVGPDGSRPYLYESVFAHEYQHLLHDDYDSDEVNWVNEGLSMFAEYLTGYVVNEDNYSTFQELPENSLTAWGDQGGEEIVADYGLVFLFHMYLYEKFDQEFIQYEFHNPDNDITSINSTLAHFSIPTTFDKIYHDFALAVLMDSKENDYRYGFENLDVQIEIGPPGKPNPDAYDTPGAPPWGADYLVLNGYESVANLKFNGYQFNPTEWTSDGEVLYSGTGDLIDNIAIFEATGGGTLTFDTYWDIEDYWDFGFVQVSTDGGYTWTSLEGDYTTYDHDAQAHPDIIANLPGLTSWSCNEAEDPCWINLSYDLSAYSGDILIAFRYMTDWGTTFEGWFIDNVYVDGTLLSDGSSTDGVLSLAQVLADVPNDYTVFLVGERVRKGKSEFKVETLMSGGYVADWTSIRQMFDNYRQLTMVVIFDAPEGTTTYAPYDIEISHKGGKHLK